MAALNYPEMLQQVKTTLFTGDHSAIYSLSCAVACIAASISLITWYNKMMNDPYGRLDMRAVIRAVIVLFLTCNFYSFVLVPFDRLTYLVTRGISASVDEKHMEAYDIRTIIREIEESRGEETFAGNFLREMEGQVADESTDTGLSFGTSSVMASEAEVRIKDKPKKPSGEKVKQFFKDVVSTFFAFPVYTLGSVLSGIISLAVKLVQWILLAVSSIYLCVLGLVGPFVFALSLMPGFKKGIHNWVARYIQISFWCPMAALVDYVNYKLTGAMIVALYNAPISAKGSYNVHLIVMELVILICLLGIPSMASWVISSAGASDLNHNLVSSAEKAAMVASKL